MSEGAKTVWAEDESGNSTTCLEDVILQYPYKVRYSPEGEYALLVVEAGDDPAVYKIHWESREYITHVNRRLSLSVHMYKQITVRLIVSGDNVLSLEIRE